MIATHDTNTTPGRTERHVSRNIVYSVAEPG